MHTTDGTLPIRSGLRHPLTGQPLRAVGWRSNGTPIWPILGGNGEGSGAGEGAAGEGGSGSDGSGAGAAGEGAPQFKAPGSQEELDRIINSAVGRAHGKYGMTADEAKAYKERVDKLEAELGSEADKAAKAARDEERSKANSEWTPRVVKAEFKAAAKGVLTPEQLTALVEDLDLSKYVTESGDADEDKIAKKIAAFAPTGNGKGAPPRQLGQGQQHGTAAEPGDQGRAMAEKRFGKAKPA